MAHTRLSAALERDQHEPVLRREWRFERLGWAALALLLLAGLAGAFGDGVIASAAIRSPDHAVELRYEGIIRKDAPAELELRLAAAPQADSVVVVSLSEDYLAVMEVQRVMPQPILVRTASGRIEHHLLRPDPSRSMVVHISVRANAVGSRRAILGVDGRLMSFRQFVLP